MLQSIGGLAGGNLLATFIGLVGTLVQARYVTPASLGYFRQFAIVSGYVYFLHLGLFGALQWLYPLYIGQGRRDKAVAVAEICQAWYLAVSSLAAGAFLLLAAYTLAVGNWRAALAWMVQAISLTVFLYGGYLGATYRSGHDFITVAKSTVISSVLSLVTLPLFPAWPYIALTLRSSLGNLGSLVYLHVRRPLRLPWRFDWREWCGLTKKGLWLFAASYGASTGWSVVEATVILKGLGTPILGLWSMSIALLESVNQVARAIVAVYSPRVIECYGRTNDMGQCLRLCRKPIAWGSICMALMAAACCMVLPFIVPLLMPKYAAAIPTMCLMMLYLPVTVLELPYTLLVAMGKTLAQNIVTYAGLGVFVVLAFAAIWAGLGLKGVIGASLLGRLVRLAMVYGYLARAKRGEAETAPPPMMPSVWPDI